MEQTENLRGGGARAPGAPLVPTSMHCYPGSYSTAIHINYAKYKLIADINYVAIAMNELQNYKYSLFRCTGIFSGVPSFKILG